ncbi:hypothetical protein D9M72_536370 [compost metagenome]
MADEDDAIVAVEDLRVEMKLVLAGEIDGITLAFRPAEEVTVIARPAGRGIFLGIAVGIGPFHVRIARGNRHRRIDFQGHPRSIRGQHDEATAERTFDADGRRILIAVGAGDPLVVVGAAPGVIRGPGAGGRHLQHPARLAASERPNNEQMVAMDRLAVPALGPQRDAIGARRPVFGNLEFEARFPAAADD